MAYGISKLSHFHFFFTFIISKTHLITWHINIYYHRQKIFGALQKKMANSR